MRSVRRLPRRWRSRASLPSGKQGADNTRVCESRSVAKARGLALGDSAQDAAHDLAGTGLRQRGGEVDLLGRGECADVMAHLLDQLPAKLFAAVFAGVECDIGVDGGALDLVWVADDCGLGDQGMADQRAFDLGRADAMSRDVDDVVDPARDPVIAVVVAATAVSGEIEAGVGFEIGLEEAAVIAPHGAHLPRPRSGDAKV